MSRTRDPRRRCRRCHRPLRVARPKNRTKHYPADWRLPPLPCGRGLCSSDPMIPTRIRTIVTIPISSSKLPSGKRNSCALSPPPTLHIKRQIIQNVSIPQTITRTQCIRFGMLLLNRSVAADESDRNAQHGSQQSTSRDCLVCGCA